MIFSLYKGLKEIKQLRLDMEKIVLEIEKLQHEKQEQGKAIIHPSLIDINNLKHQLMEIYREGINHFGRSILQMDHIREKEITKEFTNVLEKTELEKVTITTYVYIISPKAKEDMTIDCIYKHMRISATITQSLFLDLIEAKHNKVSIPEEEQMVDLEIERERIEGTQIFVNKSYNITRLHNFPFEEYLERSQIDLEEKPPQIDKSVRGRISRGKSNKE